MNELNVKQAGGAPSQPRFGPPVIVPSVVSVLGIGRGGLRGAAPVALMPAAAFAVHRLRYLLAYGSGASAELQRTGHSYLHSVAPWIVSLLALAAGGFLWSLGRAVAGQRSVGRYAASLLGLWLVCSATLVGIFAAQEFLEGLFAIGHPAGWIGIFGYGGWWAIPAALCIGLVLAALFHGARWILDAVAVARQRRARGRRTFARPAVAPALEGSIPVPDPLVTAGQVAGHLGELTVRARRRAADHA